MLVVISPAKRLDWDPVPGVETTAPDFAKEARILAGHARQLTLGNLKKLMDLSDDLARLNRDRFRSYKDDPDATETKAAVLAFAGDTYMGLDAETLDAETLDYAGRHLRILSGLYGLLRPLDAIQPYRLEMGSRLKTRRGQTLYDFWGDLPAKALNAAAATAGTDIMVNCASQEYFSAVDLKTLRPRVVTPGFYEVKDGTAKMISFHAKKARGAMARFILERRIATYDGVLEFDYLGYRHNPERSETDRPVFTRTSPD